MSKTLVIAEKPSVASDLAKALGKFTREGDYFENEQYVISSAVGHLLEIAPPDGFEPARGKWKMENLPSLPPKFELQPIEKSAARLAVLKRLIKRKDVSAIVNACDAGREGELIFRNIVRAAGAKQPISRLWLQSMTAEAIRKAFASLRSDAEMMPLADAATSRSESDWLVGINATRALTAFNSQDGGFQKTTAGRVQTPTLAILAEREEKIRAFVPRAYFEVFGDFAVTAGAYRGRWFDPAFKKTDDEDAKAERLWDRAKANAIREKCLGKPATIEDTRKPATSAPPLLYDLTSLQREANQKYGFPARMTLSIAQALYEKHKVLTYPRTDSRYLPEDHLPTAKRVLSELPHSQLINYAEKALKNGWVRPNKRIFNDAKVSDHFAIVPTGTAPKSLDETESKIFDLVCRRFVAVFFPSAQFEVTIRITTVAEEKFRTDGKIVLDPGWLAVYGRTTDGEDEESKALVHVKPGEIGQTTDVEVKESITKPPARYSEATLLSAMEGAGKFVDDEELREAMSERGLGTPATRAQIIEGLLLEGYLVRNQRELIVTAKGISLITLLRAMDAGVLTLPELTGGWEFKLRQMERGLLSRESFMQEIHALTTDLVGKVRNHMGKEVRGRFSDLDAKCPKCEAKGFAESFRAFECKNAECKLIVWKSAAGRELEREEIATLLENRSVGPLDGFRSKMGRPFSAAIVLGPGEDGVWKQRFDFENDGAADGTPAVPVNDEPLGKCPACAEGQVFEMARNYACSRVAEKQCKFTTGKRILDRDISRDAVKILLETGKTPLLKGFVSARTKRSFEAFLKVGEDHKVGFEFAPREPKTGATGGKRKPFAKKAKADTEE